MSRHARLIALAAVGSLGAGCVSLDDPPGDTPHCMQGEGCPAGDDTPAGFVFSVYKDTSINLDWNTNVISTMVPGTRTALTADMTANGARAITIAFATGECGTESWGGVPGAAMATANVAALNAAGIKYIVSTGGAAGAFHCTSDAGFNAFLDRWAGPNLVGVDFDIEAGQSEQAITELIQRAKAAHIRYPKLRFSLTLATLANNTGGATAQQLSGLPSSFNISGERTLTAVRDVLGFTGTAATWPSYMTVNLMVMDYGGGSAGVCVVSNGVCDMGQSAIQAAYNLNSRYGVPFTHIELTPMIGGNDVQSNVFRLSDVDVMTTFAKSRSLAGVHHWSWDRDIDCAPGPASPICNSLGGVGAYGFLRRFLANGIR